MGSEALLQEACELAFAVAREDAEADPAIEPPGDMRSFLYLSRLPRRAIAVAQDAIENDSGFRVRVAAQATESDVGRAGFLWLHRPAGWAPEFDELTGQIGAAEPAYSNGAGLPTEKFDDAGRTDLVGNDVPVAGDDADEADAIESELSSLRGLVDRLAGERELVLANPTPVEHGSVSSPHLEDEIAALRSDLDIARHDLSLATTELEAARTEREEAQRSQSDALRRQVELEREITSVREERAAVESRSSEFQVNSIGLEDRLTRAETQLEEVERERDVVQASLDAAVSERDELREDRANLRNERDDFENRLKQVNEQSGGVDIGELITANKSLTSELESTSRELARLISQVETTEEQLNTTTSELDVLRSERTELSSRAADAELSFETTRTQYEAATADSERLAAEVGSLRAERDGLQSQLSELQSSLTEVLDEQAEIRHRNDADRKALNEVRVERDVLQARMGDVEQSDKTQEDRIAALIKERDDVSAARDELNTERIQLRSDLSSASSARQQLAEKVDELEAKFAPLQTELQAERRQREELANRLLELDEVAATNQSEIDSLASQRDKLTEQYEAAKSDQITSKEIKRERDQILARAERAEQRAERAESQLADQSASKSASLTELSEKVALLESDKAEFDTKSAEALGELTSLRADVEELNRENAKLKFNLQVAESVANEANDAAESLRAEAAKRGEPQAESNSSETSPVADSADSANADELSLGEADEEPVEDVSIFGDVNSSDDDAPALDEAALSNGDADSNGGLVDEDGVADVKPRSRFPWSSKADKAAKAEQAAAVAPAVLDADAPEAAAAVDDELPSFAELSPLDSFDPVESGGDQVSDVVDIGSGDWASATTTEKAPDELDEISDLISQTAASFDSSKPATGAGGFGGVAAASGAAGLAAGSALGSDAPPSVFGSAGNDSARRRQIDIPADIADDEIAVAQYVVGSADVVLLVDGDSVATLGWPSLPVAQQRDALVTYLADLSASSGAAPDVVFDGRIGDDDSLPASRAVRIRLSTPPTEPSAALDELVDAYPDQWPIALVTDDAALRASALERGAAVLNNGQLLDLFIAQ